jgi:hypothetical protein
MKIFNTKIILIVCLFSSLVIAGENRNASIKIKEAGSYSEAKGYHLRCWQDGELLFEETHLNPKASKIDLRVASFIKLGEKKPNIYLMETGSSTCLYKKM